MQPIDTAAGAFLAGLVTSLHCVGMCGPLACAWTIGHGRQAAVGTMIYHSSRIAAYTVLGLMAGALGTLPLKWFHHGAGLVLPWLLVVVFAGVALGLDRWLPKPLFLSRPVARLRHRMLSVAPQARAALLGAATPLLPCGPLYLMLGLAMANGSALLGGQFAFSFGLGTLPLLALAQTQMHLLNLRFGPRTTRHVQRGLALGAAIIMAWRLHGTLTGVPEEDLACCHP
jgi:sulfite exporter TauE/SafE